MSEWCGASYKRLHGEYAIGVARLPNRKQPVLLAESDVGSIILAYFKSEEAARKAMSILDELIGLKETPK